MFSLWCSHVLIETLWNVKEDQNEFHEMLVEVLIETLWNVKLRRPAILAPVGISF